jgi:hypothetical protein
MKDKVKLFESEISRHENQLFGIYLYCRGIELLYKDSPEILMATKFHYDEIMERGNAALHDAKILLSQVKVGTKTKDDIDTFHFPQIEGLPELDDMTLRSQSLVECYFKLFPHKTRYDATKLSQEELTQLLEESAESFKRKK